MRNFWIATIPIVLALLVFITCRSQNNYPKIGELIATHASKDINKFLLQRLADNRAIFVADQEPGAWPYRKSIVDLLDYWSTSTGKSPRLDSLRNITLILEMDSLHLQNARDYMESWDFADFCDITTICSADFTTADLEFYWRLGNILHRIAVRNSHSDANNRLSLTFLSGDDIGAPENPDNSGIIRQGNRAATRIDDYAKQNPGTHFIGLFPSQHLQRSDYRESIMRPSASSSRLLTSLDSLWQGSENILIVGCISPDSWPGFADELAAPGDEYIITDPETADIINQDAILAPCTFDFLIVSPTGDALHQPIVATPSVNVMRTFIRALPRLSRASDPVQQSFWPPIITYLDGVSCGVPRHVNVRDISALNEYIRRWQLWSDTARVDIVGDVLSLKLWTRLVDQIANAQNIVARHYDEELTMLLPDAPKFDGRFGAPTNGERAAQLRVYLSRNRDEIVIRSLINILWVGDSRERTTALEALARETGMNFTTPSEWSQWFRSGKKESWEASYF